MKLKLEKVGRSGWGQRQTLQMVFFLASWESLVESLRSLANLGRKGNSKL